MKVCIISMTGLYPIEIGGPASVSYFISRELGRMGDEITLFTRVKTEGQLKRIHDVEECLRNVRVQAVRMDYGLANLLNLPSLLGRIHEATKSFSQWECDVVHYNSPPVDVAVLLPIQAKRRHEKQTLAIHGGLFYESRNILGKNIVKAERDWFDRTVVLNGFSRRIALEAGIREERLVTIPNGVDLEALGKAEPMELEGEPRVLFAGRLAGIKGVHLLIEAFKRVLAEHRKARLYIVGDGPYRGQLEELASALHVGKEISFEGFIPETTEVYRYYKSADVLVLPSLMENFSITLLEAMGSRLPVIASDVEGNSEIIDDGVNGTLFAHGNSGELAEKILTILSDRPLRMRMAERAYEGIKSAFTWDKVAESYREMFHSVIDGNSN